MEKIMIFGHKNPDTDSITSSLVMENLEKKLGNEGARAYKLGEINKETEFALNYFNVTEPETLEGIEEKAKVILVDHNDFAQSIEGIEKAEIIKVIDHHAVGGFKTTSPLYYLAEPVGCTETIIYELYKKNNIEIDKKIAGIMVSAIISDTLLFKSPTCTEKDVQVANELAKIAEINLNTYGMELLKAGTNLSDFTSEEMINIDSKLSTANNVNIQVSQVNTACIEDVLKKQCEIEQAINDFIDKNNIDIFVLLITDIINSNSEAIILGKRSDIAEKAFGKTIDNNRMFLEGVVSRKKQVFPILMENA
ncbi:MAG: manganese-dependent inorganic pyrophosphatase [Clostridia bacterium]|jgi:manganese-dependent inorganic pyrophosphatase|nr:manganese-dependent inorganic pyrophosphatase [Clostridia bacterium]